MVKQQVWIYLTINTILGVSRLSFNNISVAKYRDNCGVIFDMVSIDAKISKYKDLEFKGNITLDDLKNNYTIVGWEENTNENDKI